MNVQQPADPNRSRWQSIKRHRSGSIYWLSQQRDGQWIVTADGVAVNYPKDYDAALADLDAVAPPIE